MPRLRVPDRVQILCACADAPGGGAGRACRGRGGGAFWRSSTARRGCRCAVTVPGLAVNAAGARARWARSPLRVVLDRGRSLRVLLPADDDARSFNGGQCVGARHTCCTHAVIWYDGSGGDSAQRCEIRDGLATESGWWQKWPG